MGFAFPFVYNLSPLKECVDFDYVLNRVNSGTMTTSEMIDMGLISSTLKEAAVLPPRKIEDNTDLLLQNFQRFLERHPQLHSDTYNMLRLLPAILELQAQKAEVYGRSYCRHGDLSIFFNVERKWDRISNIMEKAMKNGTGTLHDEGTPTETFVDTVVDLASYGLLWVGYIMESHPEAYQKFLEVNGLVTSTSGKANILPRGFVDSSDNR